MAKVLVIHGAGMNMRGKVQTEIFGPMTLPEYDERIRGYAAELGLEIEIFHSNIEGEIVNKLYEANDKGFDAALFNPAAFGSGYPVLVAAISQVRFPTIEVHISNPIRRGPASETARVSHGVVAGFGLPGYFLALRGVRKGGSVTLVGNVAPKIDFPLQVAVTRELTLHGSCASRGEYPACLEMLARGALKAAPLLSTVAPLSEGAKWFERLYQKEAGLLKVVLKP